jgi:Xaa-Pro dipeptidase
MHDAVKFDEALAQRGPQMSGMAFPAEEFEDRLRRIRMRMGDAAMDALILTRGENIFYATGFKASHFASWLCELHAAIIPAAGAPRLMTRSLEREATKIQWTRSPKLYRDHEDPYDVLVGVLEETGNAAKTIGIEERFLKVSQLKKMQHHLPGARFVDISGMIEGVAASPSEAESACMREAARITNIGLQTGLRAVKEGVYPYEIIGRIHDAMYQAGQRDFDMSLVAVWSGPQGGRMHDTSTTEKVKHGDIATVEVMGVDNHYKAGAQACVYVGDDPPKPIVDAYKLVTDMHAKAKNAVRAGVTTGDIFDAASSVYRAARGSDYYRRCGGSMGLTVFTLDLVKGRREVLNPGVSLLIQTLVDDPVLLTCANTVMVTASGYEELTQPILSLKPAF